MYEFLANHALYIVMIILLIIWAGISGFIFSLDRKVAKLESLIKED